MDAGFTQQEMILLTGARATGWATETGAPVENELGLTGAHYSGGGGGGGGSLGSEMNLLRGRASHHTNMSPMDEEGRGHFHPSHGTIHVGAAEAAAMAAVAAGLTPTPHHVHPALQKSAGEKGLFSPDRNREGHMPGLAMGIGMGLASGVAATINAALFQGRHLMDREGGGPVSKVPSSSVTVAAAATVRPPPLNDLGIHQVEASDGTHGEFHSSLIQIIKTLAR